jgi:hypothetical protein
MRRTYSPIHYLQIFYLLKMGIPCYQSQGHGLPVDPVKWLHQTRSD